MNAYLLYSILWSGLLNKVFMFDKVNCVCVYVHRSWTQVSIVQGCTFLCVFGLPHAKHEDDPARALKTARQIFNNLNHLQLELEETHTFHLQNSSSRSVHVYIR